MTLLTEPTRIVLAKGYSLPDDSDAVAYIAAVEAADGQGLETATRMAINSFVKGCKADGIWPAIKASCILAGARTLTGALVPLVGTAPTNFNFVSGDYNRETGLIGNGSTKYLDSNRNNNADPQNSKHISVFVSVAATVSPSMAIVARQGSSEIGGTRIELTSGGPNFQININASAADGHSAATTNFIGASRSDAATFIARAGSSSATITRGSVAPASQNMLVYARANAAPTGYSNARLAFYSIGESLDLALLDARVTALINAFAAAIP